MPPTRNADSRGSSNRSTLRPFFSPEQRGDSKQQDSVSHRNGTIQKARLPLLCQLCSLCSLCSLWRQRVKWTVSAGPAIVYR